MPTPVAPPAAPITPPLHVPKANTGSVSGRNHLKAVPEDSSSQSLIETAPSTSSQIAEPPSVQAELTCDAETQNRDDRSAAQATSPTQSSGRPPVHIIAELLQARVPTPEPARTVPAAAPKERTVRNPFVRQGSLPRRGLRDTEHEGRDEPPGTVSASAPRSREARPALSQNLPATRGAIENLEATLPSARTILAAHRPRAASPPPTAKLSAWPLGRPMPTVVREPDQWTLPFWPAWISAIGLTLVLGLAGFALTWTWAEDDWAAGLLANRLLDKRSSLTEGVTPHQLNSAPRHRLPGGARLRGTCSSGLWPRLEVAASPIAPSRWSFCCTRPATPLPCKRVSGSPRRKASRLRHQVTRSPRVSARAAMWWRCP